MTVQTPHIAAGEPGPEHLNTCHLNTGRLTLRPVSLRDGDAFVAIAGDWEVARMTSDLPHPLTSEQAASWLSPGDDDTRFAIEKSGRVIGTIGYFIATKGVAELGFIIARSHWGWGYASEAAQAVVAYGFGTGELETFTSAHFEANVASARVLEKVGFGAVGQQLTWCVSRACDMQAVCYELNYPMAMTKALASATTKTPGRDQGHAAIAHDVRAVADAGDTVGEKAQFNGCEVTS